MTLEDKGQMVPQARLIYAPVHNPQNDKKVELGNRMSQKMGNIFHEKKN